MYTTSHQRDFQSRSGEIKAPGRLSGNWFFRRSQCCVKTNGDWFSLSTSVSDWRQVKSHHLYNESLTIYIVYHWPQTKNLMIPRSSPRMSRFVVERHRAREITILIQGKCNKSTASKLVLSFMSTLGSLENVPSLSNCYNGPFKFAALWSNGKLGTYHLKIYNSLNFLAQPWLLG